MKKNKGNLCRMLRFCIWYCMIVGVIWGVCHPLSVHADIYDASDLIYADWEAIGELETSSARGWPQSICVTDKYIVCLINGAAAEAIPDTLIAFNKDDYSYAFEVTERDYEHGNGMTYNSKTNEIYVMPGPCLDKENEGNIYVVDADTLHWKRTFQSSSGQNFGGIEYLESTDQYVVSGGNGSKFRLMNSDFEILKIIAPRTKPAGSTYQDFCVTGDYIISPCYDGESKVDNYFVIYSLSQGEYLNTFYADLQGADEKKEIESLCEIEPGKIMLGVGISNPRRVRLYVATLRAAYDITASAKNGTISASEETVEGGTDYQVNFQPNEHYELSQLIVDGEQVESDPKQTEYTFRAVSGNHSVQAIFAEIPQYKIKTKVIDGKIDETASVYRDEDWTVSYKPKKHYELSSIWIDGTSINIENAKDSYTFTNIQGKHDIRVKYTEIPSWAISTSVKNGTISDSIRKAYRGSSHTIQFEGKKDYVLYEVKVDGVKVDKKQFTDSYTFADISGAHNIQVVYIWKYLWVCALLGAAFAAFLIFYIRIRIIRRKKRKKRQEERELRAKELAARELAENENADDITENAENMTETADDSTEDTEDMTQTTDDHTEDAVSEEKITDSEETGE